MTDPYGQQPYGQQPGGQQPFGQPQPGQPFGQQAPYGQPAPFGQPGTPFGAPQNYANWGQRAGALLIDMAPLIVIDLFGYILLFAVSYALGSILIWLGGLAGLAWTVYNRWLQGGNTGQSMGKRIMNIKLVSEQTGQPIGPLNAFLRDLAHIVDGLPCYIGYLWPLWDDKSQTFADKILTTVVVNAEGKAPASFAEAAFGQPGQNPFGGGFGQPPQSQPGGFGQQPGQPGQPGGFGQPPSGGFPQQQPGGFPPPQQPGQPGGYGQPPQSGGFGQPPQQGGFGQPGQPGQGAYGQPPQPGGFGGQPGQPQGGAFEEGERTQMIRPDAGGRPGFDEQAERTQMLRPEGQDQSGQAESTQKIQPGQFGQPPQPPQQPGQPPQH